MSAIGYEQTLDGPRCEVCFPLGSRHRRTEFQKPCVLGPVTAQKRTSHAASANVSFWPKAAIARVELPAGLRRRITPTAAQT